MKKLLFGFAFCICMMNARAQLTLIVNSTPQHYMPLWDSIYVAGTFNNWQPGNVAYSLTPQANGSYRISLNLPAGYIEFKFTRGAWNIGETQSSGAQLPNRTFTYNGTSDSVFVQIAAWEDFPPGVHTAAQGVYVLDGNFFMPQLNRFRRIWIYLPGDYYNSTRTYRTIYMMDGQNVFDAATSYAGEWNVDDTLHQIESTGDSSAIVVAIDNGGTLRIDEYAPYVNSTYGGGNGDAFADFIAQTLKPAIDNAFRTNPSRDYTAIAGSSLGANISLYTALKYQNIFSKVGLFSPAYWFNDSLYTFVSIQGMQQPMRCYQVCSVNEGASVVTNQARMMDTLVQAGFSGSEIQTTVRSYGAHNEAFWRMEFNTGYQWLFSNSISAIEEINFGNDLKIYPNPADSFVRIKNSFDGKFPLNVVLTDIQGRACFTTEIKNAENEITLPAPEKNGQYFILITDNKKTVHPGRFLVKH